VAVRSPGLGTDLLEERTGFGSSLGVELTVQQ
jgi:hypothetical protein